MNKTSFRELVNYIKNHPSDARLLAEALEQTTEMNMGMGNRASVGKRTNQYSTFCNGENPSEGHAEAEQEGTLRWLLAREVGEQIGFKARWVIDRRSILPPGYVRRSKSGRGKPAWMFHPESVELLKQYR